MKFFDNTSTLGFRINGPPHILIFGTFSTLKYSIEYPYPIPRLFSTLEYIPEQGYQSNSIQSRKLLITYCYNSYRLDRCRTTVDTVEPR